MNHNSRPEPLGITLGNAIELFGSESLVRDAIQAGWITPLVQRGRLTLLNHKQVLEAWDRIQTGELPPRRKSNQENPTDPANEYDTI